jgi:hypothetical protein
MPKTVVVHFHTQGKITTPYAGGMYDIQTRVDKPQQWAYAWETARKQQATKI